jgi:lipoyl(octanoyl) transferase
MKAQKACRYFIFPELVGYTTAWKYQRALAQHMHLQREEGQYIPDFLLLLQHPSVYTLGKGGLIENIKETNRTSMSDIYRVERGGDITWHGNE